jgi:hypothetical protein
MQVVPWKAYLSGTKGKEALRLQFPVRSLNVTGNVTKRLDGVNVITNRDALH